MPPPGSARLGARWLVALTALAIIVDGIDNQLLGIAIPAMMRDWTVDRAAFAPVVAAGLFGMMIGGATAGMAGDRAGRRIALLASITLFGAATLAIGGVDNVAMLAKVRLLAGIGLGGALPNAAALAAEYVSPRERPMAVTATIVCVPLGGTLAGLIAVPLLPAVGWRGLFIVCGALSFAVAAALLLLLPESPQYHANRASQPRAVIITAEYRGDTIALWAAFVSCLTAVYLGFSWLPSVLASAKLGPAIASSSLAAFNVGGVFGALGGGALISRFGSRRPMLAMTAGAIVGAIALMITPIGRDSIIRTLTLLTITGGLINAVQTTMYALAANVYPTAIRATGVGAAVAIGRSGAILSGYTGPAALDHGSSAFFGVMAASLLVTFLALTGIQRHVLASKTFEEMTARVR